jgi:plasmid maintenance system antidote protein VapI
MKAKTSNLTATLKRAIRRRALPLLTIEQATGVKRATVLRFMRGDSDVTLGTADRLAAYFGVRAVEDKEE